jgi:DNA-binding winged helix-turn-helix (wHTH) protein/Tol biopolymer transport system component
VNAPDLPKSSERRREPFRLGDLEVRPDSGEVHGPRGTIRLRPLLVQILVRLAAEPGEVVRRETLLEEVWPRRMVNDEVLSRAIAELRTALGDDARAPRYIETLPKIGYRLSANVGEVEKASSRQEPVARSQEERRSGFSWLLAPGAWLPALLITLVLAAAALFLWSPWRSPASADLVPRVAAARVFTSDPALEVGPRFSPDGKQVAFALGQGASSRIVIQAVDTSSRRFVGDGADLRLTPIFFPDARRIAYWKRAAGTCSIVEHDLASGDEKALLDCALSPRARFDLSRDGTRIVFAGQAHREQPAGLWIQELRTGAAPVALTSPQAGAGDDLLPRFSPDGARVIFFRGNESHRQAWVVETGGSRSARAIGPHEGLVYGAAWLGENGPVIVAADWLGFRALNLLDLESGAATLLGARGARFPDVGTGGRIAWEHAEYSANFFLARPGAEPAMLWRSTRYSGQAEFSPDGRQVAFASNRDGTDAIYVAALDGPARRVAFGEAWRYSRPHWSADGSAVYATRVAVGGRGPAASEAVRIPASGGPIEVLAATGAAADIRESRDGKWLYSAVPAANALSLWRAPRGQPGASQRLPLPPVSHFHMNGDWLVFAQPQLSRLTACRLESLACAPLAVELEPDGLYHWAIGPRSLYVRLRERGNFVVAVHDIASGERRGTLPLAPSGAGSSIAVAPDEGSLLIAQEEGPTVDLMLAR